MQTCVSGCKGKGEAAPKLISIASPDLTRVKAPQARFASCSQACHLTAQGETPTRLCSREMAVPR